MAKCSGAVCSMWGDPHVDSCDNAQYDCHADGLITMMENHLFKIQGHFVPVGDQMTQWLAEERAGRFNYGATWANDIAVQLMPQDKEENAVTFQLGFGNLNQYVDPVTREPFFPSETGCLVNRYYGGQYLGHQKVSNLMVCRDNCESDASCTAFNYWQDHTCTLQEPLNEEDQYPYTPGHGRVVAGSMSSTCGLPPQEMPIEEQESRLKHGRIGDHNCPLLFHVDGELQDISNIDMDNGYLYGDATSKISVQMMPPQSELDRHGVRILREMPYGHPWYSEAYFTLQGTGPGEQWPCHWNFDVCLPATEEWQTNSVGLLGTPNGDSTDEFNDRDGNIIDMDAMIEQYTSEFSELTEIAVKERAWLDYCHDEWCVDEEDSIFTPSPGQTMDDILCNEQVYADPDPVCVMSDAQIEEACGQYIDATYEACRLDCCNGFCEEDFDTYNHDQNATQAPIQSPACINDEFFDTSTTTCPNNPAPLVSLLAQKGPSLPEDGVVFYDINPNAGNDDFRDVTFRVNNPFDAPADIFVKHVEDENENGFQSSKCAYLEDVPSGCDVGATVIEVACRKIDGKQPFAVVIVYFASQGIDLSGDQAEIDVCCKPPDYESTVGVASYTFEVKCSCPDDTAAQ